MTLYCNEAMFRLEIEYNLNKLESFNKMSCNFHSIEEDIQLFHKKVSQKDLISKNKVLGPSLEITKEIL